MGRYTDALRKLEEEKYKRRPESSGLPPARSSRFKPYAIGVVVCLVITLILVYAFGVRQGAEIIKTSVPVPAPVPEPPSSAPVQEADTTSSVNQLAAGGDNALLLESVEDMMKLSYSAPTSNETPVPQLEFYTIQLVTYESSERAQVEAERLKANGFSAFIVRNGKYHEVCIEKFETRAPALNRLSEIRSSSGADFYPDAFVRYVKRKAPSAPGTGSNQT